MRFEHSSELAHGPSTHERAAAVDWVIYTILTDVGATTGGRLMGQWVTSLFDGSTANKQPRRPAKAAKPKTHPLPFALSASP